MSINGDGGFLYCATELATAMQHGINVVALVFNDNAYGNVKRIQQMRFGGRTIASDLYNPDMEKLAGAYGVEFHRARSPEELRRTLHEVWGGPMRPVLIEAPVGEMPQMQFQAPPRLPGR